MIDSPPLIGIFTLPTLSTNIFPVASPFVPQINALTIYESASGSGCGSGSGCINLESCIATTVSIGTIVSNIIIEAISPSNIRVVELGGTLPIVHVPELGSPHTLRVPLSVVFW